MKFQAILLAATLVASSFAQAATSNSSVSTQAPKNIWASETASQGLRVTVMKPWYDAEIKASGYGESLSSKGKVNKGYSLGLGYANLPIQQLGWTGNVFYIHFPKEGEGDGTSGMMRLDGNLAYAINEIVSIKGGINLSKLVSGTGSDKFSPSIGFQAGLGTQFTSNLGLDLNYVQMNQTASIEGISVDLKLSGFELALHGTF